MLDVVMVDGRDLRSQQAEFGTTLTWLREVFGSDATALVHAAAAELLPEREVAADPAALRLQAVQRVQGDREGVRVEGF